MTFEFGSLNHPKKGTKNCQGNDFFWDNCDNKKGVDNLVRTPVPSLSWESYREKSGVWSRKPFFWESFTHGGVGIPHEEIVELVGSLSITELVGFFQMSFFFNNTS